MEGIEEHAEEGSFLPPLLSVVPSVDSAVSSVCGAGSAIGRELSLSRHSFFEEDMLCCGGPAATSAIAPQQRTKIARRPSLFEALDEIDLRNILADPADRVHLRRWARRCSCLAPIDFLIELNDLEAAIGNTSIEEVKELAARISRTYLAKNAVHTVCDDISDSLQRKIIVALSFSSVSLANSIIHQTKTVMLRFVRSDILARFKESDDFKAMRNLHPCYVLATMKPVREAFLATLPQIEKDALLLWLSAWELQKQQEELNRKGNDLIRKSAFMDSAKSQLEMLGLERDLPLHMGMSSAMRSSLRKLQDQALAGFVEAYVDFIVGAEGSKLILELDSDPEVKVCFSTLSHCERFELCSASITVGDDTVASDSNPYGYACDW